MMSGYIKTVPEQIEYLNTVGADYLVAKTINVFTMQYVRHQG